MKRLLFLLAFLFSLPALATNVTGSRVQQTGGQILASGSWCFAGSGCSTVTNGAFSGTVTAGTQTVTIVNGATTYLTVNSVVISGSNFTWDTFIQTGTATGIGAPYLACAVGASYTQTDGGTAWTCANVAGQATWQLSSTSAISPTGSYSGFGSPAFTCTAPCTYTNYAASPFWSTTASSGFPANSWIQTNPANSSLFSAVGSGSNTSATMNVGTGASLQSTGGILAANYLTMFTLPGRHLPDRFYRPQVRQRQLGLRVVRALELLPPSLHLRGPLGLPRRYPTPPPRHRSPWPLQPSRTRHWPLLRSRSTAK